MSGRYNAKGIVPHPRRFAVVTLRRENLTMATQNLTEPLKVGTLVKIRNSGYRQARIAEFRGHLGPNGARVYRVRVRKKPQPAYIEVCKDQLESVNGS